MKKNLFYCLTIACFYLSGCVAFKQPVITGITNPKISGNTSDMHLKFDVLLKNPNNYGLTLQKMQMEVFLEDSSISVIGLDHKMHIAANADASIPFNVQPKVSMFPQLILFSVGQLFKKNSKIFSVKGDLVVRKFLFRKKYLFEYP